MSLSVAGHFERVGTSRSCTLQVWVPGDKAPQPAEVAGMSAPQIVRQAPGSAALGVSGGWIVNACLSGGDYRLTLR